MRILFFILCWNIDVILFFVELKGGIKGKEIYTAPEIHLNDDTGKDVYSTKADVYSFGVVLFEMITHGAADWFDGKKKSTVVNSIKAGVLPILSEQTNNLCSEIILKSLEKVFCY